jgi:septal ring factor EnvC (AmiA/AmiB activator)
MIDFVSVVAGLISLLAGSVATSEVFKKLIMKLLGRKAPLKTYTERLSELTTNLTKASSEVDQVLAELAKVSMDREKAVKDLETGLGQLEKREKELKERIEVLQNVPLPVAEHFAMLVEPSEKRSARRDYVLFGAGVVVTTIIAVIIQLFTGK